MCKVQPWKPKPLTVNDIWLILWNCVSLPGCPRERVGPLGRIIVRPITLCQMVRMKTAGIILLVISALLLLLGTPLSMALSFAHINGDKAPAPSELAGDLGVILWCAAAAVPPGLLGLGLLIIAARKAAATQHPKSNADKPV